MLLNFTSRTEILVWRSSDPNETIPLAPDEKLNSLPDDSHKVMPLLWP